MKHHNNFDLIRLLAALQVLYVHSAPWLKLPTYRPLDAVINDFYGVAVFFVVSGFLVSGSWLRSNKDIRVYADHRIRRIYPGLWVNLTVIFALLIISGSVITAFPKLPLFITTTYIFGSDEVGQRFAGSIVKHGGFYEYFPSGVLWTIPVEFGFYLLVPVIFSRRYKTDREIMRSIGAWFAVSLLLQFVWESQGPFSIFRFLWLFLVGATLNIYWDKVKFYLEDRAIYWILGYLALVTTFQHVGLSVYFVSPTITGVLSSIVLGLTVVSIAHSFKTVAGFLINWDISYGIYLWHMPIIFTMIGFGYTSTWAYGAVAYLLTFAFATISWVAIERPVLRGKLRPSKASEISSEIKSPDARREPATVLGSQSG